MLSGAVSSVPPPAQPTRHLHFSLLQKREDTEGQDQGGGGDGAPHPRPSHLQAFGRRRLSAAASSQNFQLDLSADPLLVVS